MAEHRKKDVLKNIITTLGVTLVLVGSMAANADFSAPFVLGLLLLVIHAFDLKGTDEKKLVAAQIMISIALIIGAITQIVMAKSFAAPQVFLIVLFLGSSLIFVESLRKFVEFD